MIEDNDRNVQISIRSFCEDSVLLKDRIESQMLIFLGMKVSEKWLIGAARGKQYVVLTLSHAIERAVEKVVRKSYTNCRLTLTSVPL